eukprot:ctg_348.g259
MDPLAHWRREGTPDRLAEATERVTAEVLRRCPELAADDADAYGTAATSAAVAAAARQCSERYAAEELQLLEGAADEMLDEWARPLNESLEATREACRRVADMTEVGRRAAGTPLYPQARVQQVLQAYRCAQAAMAGMARLAELEEDAEGLAAGMLGGEQPLSQVDADVVKLVERRTQLEQALRNEWNVEGIRGDEEAVDAERQRETLEALVGELYQRTGGDVETLVQNECRARIKDCVRLVREDRAKLVEAVNSLSARGELGISIVRGAVHEAVAHRALECELSSATEQIREADRRHEEAQFRSVQAQPAAWVRGAISDLVPGGEEAEEDDSKLADTSSHSAAARPAVDTAAAATADAPADDSAVAERVLQVADALVEDLTSVADQIDPLFPRRFYFLECFAVETHEVLNAQFWSVIARASLIPGKQILSLISWIEEYHGHLIKLFPTQHPLAPGAAAVSTDEDTAPFSAWPPALHLALDAPSQRLSEGYAARALEMMKHWIGNCVEVDATSLIDVYGDSNALYTQAPVDVFRIVNDEMAIVAEHAQRGNPLFVQRVCDACAAALLVYRSMSAAALDGHDADDGALERVCAAANNHRRCEELAGQFAERCHAVLDQAIYAQAHRSTEPVVSRSRADASSTADTEAPTGSAALSEDSLSVDGIAHEFAVSAEHVATRACNVIFLDLDEAPGLWPRLYLHGWAAGEEEVAGSVVATVADFFGDINEFLRRDADKMAAFTECARRIADRYVAQLALLLGADRKNASNVAAAANTLTTTESTAVADADEGGSENLAHRITGGGPSRLLRAVGAARGPRITLEPNTVARLRADRQLFADYFIHDGGGSSVAITSRCLAPLDALADMLDSAGNAACFAESYAHLLAAHLAADTLQLWAPSMMERLLLALQRSAAAATPEWAAAARIECRRLWQARGQPPVHG